MPLSIVRNDLTKMRVDAIVNAANTDLKNYAPVKGGGVCGAIFRAAGNEKLQKSCDKLAPIRTGEAVVTPGFDLCAKYIIHAAGPIYHDGIQNEEELLRLCYINSLTLAHKKNCKSIAFPLISSGIYGYPKVEALSVATNAIKEWLMKNESDMEVSLVVFDKEAFELSQKLLGEVKSFIDENYIGDYADSESLRIRKRFDTEQIELGQGILEKLEEKAENITEPVEPIAAEKSDDGAVDFIKPAASAAKPQTMKQMRRQEAFAPPASVLDDFAKRLDEPFSKTLLKLIDAKGKTDVEVYKRANIDRKLFSKIRTGKNYIPGKKTVVALAIALELTFAETDDLLERAGFALSRSVMFDVIVEYFIKNKKYDIFEINNVLFKYDQPILGG